MRDGNHEEATYFGEQAENARQHHAHGTHEIARAQRTDCHRSSQRAQRELLLARACIPNTIDEYRRADERRSERVAGQEAHRDRPGEGAITEMMEIEEGIPGAPEPGKRREQGDRGHERESHWNGWIVAAG